LRLGPWCCRSIALACSREIRNTKIRTANASAIRTATFSTGIKGDRENRGWRGRNHWHYRPGGRGGREHLQEGDEIPDSSQSCNIEPRQLLDRYGRPLAIGIGTAIIVGTLIEDLLTAGGGIIDDPVTIGVGVGLIQQAIH
jgi:hypothetical protein